MTAESNRARRVAPEIRFQRSIEIHPDTGCWIWTGRLKSGDPCFYDGTRDVSARRWAHGRVRPVPEDRKCSPATCGGELCVLPAHVPLLTHSELLRGNPNLGAHNRGKTECAKGHPLNAENTYVATRKDLDGGVRHTRGCRPCDAVRKRASRHAARPEG